MQTCSPKPHVSQSNSVTENELSISKLRKTLAPRFAGGLLLLVLLTLALMLSVAFGTREVGWPEIAAALSGQVETIGDAAVASRLPRTLLAILAGAALGISGGVMQGLTRNPLADPGLLGVNAGAALAVVIGIAWFGIEETTHYIWAALFGAGFTAVAVYAIANLARGGATPLRLALAGAATTAALSSLVTAVILPRGDIAGLVQSWLVGGVGGATYDQILPVLPFLLAGFVITLLAARKLNLLALGDDTAAGLGEKVALARAMSALGAVLLCGPITAVCGPIGFVGLVVPHACRLLVGGDYRWLLPFSALGGAALLTFSDVAGRLVAHPSELDVGIVTAFIGAPVFIWIVRNRKVGSL
ncbi:MULTISPECIES: iron ABC transporter permease [unclassified Halomonas]|uniref:FecCD family ABC transporter permease n=1 Tax=unclassified Halomonas TaxID=2609666 RepID=UPI0007D8FF4E|nr:MULTISPECIES: iron ABC transporter permease [unclassified Halomonas]MBT2787755.1 iron ABC transporter permease [Halomonas sp. ISL-106]MBT2799634.1 iron ABC transporter permease [Halomonas sp. ISL-104]OAL61407.1 iron ABC transporter permease [Halomonas sp. ALS9]